MAVKFVKFKAWDREMGKIVRVHETELKNGRVKNIATEFQAWYTLPDKRLVLLVCIGTKDTHGRDIWNEVKK